MQEVCPLCGRKNSQGEWHSRLPRDPVEIDNQIANLDLVLENLQSGEESLLTLIDNRIEMCPLCQELMEGIEDEADKHELEVRLNRTVEQLEEKVEDLYTGQL